MVFLQICVSGITEKLGYSSNVTVNIIIQNDIRYKLNTQRRGLTHLCRRTYKKKLGHGLLGTLHLFRKQVSCYFVNKTVVTSISVSDLLGTNRKISFLIVSSLFGISVLL